MGFLRSKAFAWTVAALTVAAFALPGVGAFGLAVGGAVAAAIVAAHKTFNRPDRVLYRTLLRRVHGDREHVERLLAQQRAHHPHASRAEHMRGAIRSWERELN